MAKDADISSIHTTCPYCGVGCGIEVDRVGARDIRVKGDRAHPANYGRLCSKGTALGKTFGLEGRLLEPRIRQEDGTLKPATWDEALDRVARTFSDIIAKHGPDSVAFYVSGQLLTEDYYAINKLAKGYIGTANIDTNSRLCMSSAVAAHKLAFGADLVSGIYEDVEQADLLIFSGHNAAWTHPVLFRRLEANQAQKRICIDPKRTDTAKACDLHLMIRPQTDVRLWNGLCAYLIAHDLIDHDYIEAHTDGFSRLMACLSAEDQNPEAIAADCGIALEDLLRFYSLFAETEKTVSLFSQGSNQSAQGVNKGLALINAHLLTGKIGKSGAAPFSITGQPNAMGGREVGGLANMLAAHMDFDEASKSLVQRFWQSPVIAQKPGLKAVDMFEAMAEGKIKAVWIMATNPLVSLPDTDRVRKALEACELVVVSDVVERTDTLDVAHIQLPAAAWGEKSGTVTNSERVISRQKAFAPLPPSVMPDWKIIAEVARRMNAGWSKAFDWNGAHEIFTEHAKLTAFENNGERFLNLGGFSTLSKREYDVMLPTRWPFLKSGKSVMRLFGDGRYQTLSKRARLNPVVSSGPANPISAEFPFHLNTTRIRDHWHTMTRTALAPELNRHMAEPLVDINPIDAVRLKIDHGHLARVISPKGVAILKANITKDVREGCLSLPIHWTKQFAPTGRSNHLIIASADNRSGQPEFKHTPARIEAYGETWHGFVLMASGCAKPQFSSGTIWRKIVSKHAHGYEIAGIEAFSELDALIGPETLSLEDRSLGVVRRVLTENGRLKVIVYLAPISVPLPSRDWLLDRFGDEVLSDENRAAVLLGKFAAVEDTGKIICACNSVGQKTIETAISNGADTVESIGHITGAGTSCGSCKGELKQCLMMNRVRYNA